MPTKKLLDVEPAATVTVPGTVATALLDEMSTTIPPVGAGPLNVTVPVTTADGPPAVEVGDTATPINSGIGAMVRFSETDAAPDVAVIIAVVFAETALVVIVNVVVVAPPGTVTNGGNFDEGLLVRRLTTSPPAGAAIARVIVAIELKPPVTVLGLSVRLVTGTVFTSVPIA